MLVIYPLDVIQAILLCDRWPFDRGTTGAGADGCSERCVIALAVEEDARLAGFAIAESTPRALHILELEGPDNACPLLLERLVRIAGERDLSACCPADHANIRALVEELGFLELFQEEDRCYYYWDRNSDLFESC